jgi:GNAT superfamily N-acetyltransferase
VPGIADGRDRRGVTGEMNRPNPQVRGYPDELARDVKTREGETVRVRPIRPDDAPALVAFHDHLSPLSVYRRFFSLHPKLSAAEVRRFTCVDYVDRLALVAEDHGRLIAVARYDRRPGTTEAEVAFVVSDAYQHHGIATLLLEELSDAGWNNGIQTFFAVTLTENRDMLDVFTGSGFPVTTSLEEGTVNVRFSIEPTKAYGSARARRHAQAEKGSSGNPI